MDEQIPSLNPPFDIPNIPISVPISLPIISHQTTQNQAQISSDYMLNLFNPLGSSSISTIYDNNYKPLASPSVSINKDKNVGSHEVDHKISGSENKANKIPAMSRKKKSAPQRIAFHTRTDNDVLDDGFRWRKYGQKTVKNSNHPRSYYRCSHHTCSVKKQIQRLSKDSSIVVTTYEGIHNHPSESLMESLNPLLKQLQFFTRI